MQNPSVTEAYKLFYDNVLSKEHNNPDFIARWGADPGRFETQIVCNKSGVKLDNGKFEQSGEVFGPQRWPYEAGGNANYSDPPIQYIIQDRMQCIGTTWWSWKDQKTIGLGFDFDSIIGHAPGVGISEAEIAKIDQFDIDWLEIVRSTRGKGRHVYIWFDPDNAPHTENHHAHAALARSFLPLIAKDTGLDIEASVDVCGGVMWIHHQDTTPENQGYACIKPATQILTADHCPPNWRDNLEVVSGSRSRVRVQGWTADGLPTEDGDDLDEMTQAYAKVDLTEEHLRVLSALEGTGHTSLWVHDHHLFQGHTSGLKQVFDDFAEQGKPLRGLFNTNSPDSDGGKPNCLTGDTRVITRRGLKPIKDLAGKNVKIITARGAWVEAPFKSYGEQDVFAVTLKRGKDIKVIHATKDHGWFVCKSKSRIRFDVRKKVHTEDLENGQVLVQLKPRNYVRPSITGIHHGLVWGDGTHGGKYKTSVLPLYGDKDAELLRFFVGHPRRELAHSVGGTVITNLPYHFKSLVPLQYDKSYLYGWLAGYFAADGCAEENGRCRIVSASVESVEHVKQVCHILGIETSSISKRTVKNSKYDFTAYEVNLKALDLEEDFFLLTSHRERWLKWSLATTHQRRYWRVVDVKPAGREEVFCCTVPDTHCFCLEDFILVSNCFARPKPNGAWDVYRFGEGTDEHPLWDTTGKWTKTTYNYPATLKQICFACEGYEGTDDKQGYMFEEVEHLKAALVLLKSKLKVPEKADGRCVALHDGPKGSVILSVEKKRDDKKSDFPRFVKTPRGWEIFLNDAVDTSSQETESETLWAELDQQIRALKVPTDSGSKFDSWVMQDGDQSWTEHPRENIKAFLLSEGHAKPDPILGGAVFKSWSLVSEPFVDEYPGGRKWNRNAVQFIYPPAEMQEGEAPQHPTWTRVMEHCGSELNEYLPELPWCQPWGIVTGGDYLIAWIACMFQRPFGKLPYLFLYGPQNTGKSSFHESIALLLTKGGVEKADRALTSDQGYNGELVGAILAVIDDVDIAKAGSGVYNRIKEWVTGLSISIHAKYKQVMTIPNCLHFVQAANNRRALPVLPGDTRITALSVQGLAEEIPKDAMLEMLRKEAPQFMRTLLDHEIPPAIGRLMLPVVETQGKVDAANDNVNELEQFITEQCHEVPGAAIKFAEFKQTFLDSLEVFQQTEWKERQIRAVVSERLMYGTSAKHNQKIVANISFDPNTKPSVPYVKDGGVIIREDEVV